MWCFADTMIAMIENWHVLHYAACWIALDYNFQWLKLNYLTFDNIAKFLQSIYESNPFIQWQKHTPYITCHTQSRKIVKVGALALDLDGILSANGPFAVRVKNGWPA